MHSCLSCLFFCLCLYLYCLSFCLCLSLKNWFRPWYTYAYWVVSSACIAIHSFSCLSFSLYLVSIFHMHTGQWACICAFVSFLSLFLSLSISVLSLVLSLHISLCISKKLNPLLIFICILGSEHACFVRFLSVFLSLSFSLYLVSVFHMHTGQWALGMHVCIRVFPVSFSVLVHLCTVPLSVSV